MSFGAARALRRKPGPPIGGSAFAAECGPQGAAHPLPEARRGKQRQGALRRPGHQQGVFPVFPVA